MLNRRPTLKDKLMGQAKKPEAKPVKVEVKKKK